MRLHLTFVFCCALFFITGQSAFSAPEQQVAPTIDAEFSAAVSAIGAARKTNHSAAFDAASYFTEMKSHHSLKEIRVYIDSKFPMQRFKDWSGNYDFVEILDPDLSKFDKHFLRYDFLRLAFAYNPEWTDITKFIAVLGNKAS